MKILVTGTSRGLGFGLATYLSKHHEVVGCARGKVDGKTDFLHIAGIDLTIEESYEKLSLNQFEVMINNIGVAQQGLLATQSEESISETILTNLISPLKLTKKYVRERLAIRESGVIINISSIVSIRGYSGLVAYSASKAGLDGMTRSLARELGSKGFRVNSILPGYMITDMSKSLTEDQKKQIIRRTPLGRFASLTEIAAVCDFLVSDGGAFITGQTIVVDGGLTA